MKKQLCAVFFVLLTHLVLGQGCDPSTPVFNANLTGQPNGTWYSTPVSRNGKCCGVTGSDVCIQFNLILDPLANGIRFDIVAGAIPSGALFYQINCGPPQAVGQPICLSGPGPHIITFCKPGNNTNIYAITSIPVPSLAGTQIISQACKGTLVAEGLVKSTITWTSVPNNPVYNSYLNCTSGCDTVRITPPSFSLPPYVDYQVCGYVIGGCVPFYFCDTMRVYFVNDLAVDISPANPTICFGGANATFSALGSGGVQPYSYVWNTGDTTATITKGPGTYIVSLRDGRNCSIAYDTVTVIGLSSPISANAGPDGLLCLSDQSYTLNGSVVVATGGQWIGNGTFAPSTINLNAQYTPTAGEVSAGYSDIQLITTGNFGCPPDTDEIRLIISANPDPAIVGLNQVCEYSSAIYSTAFTAGNSYSWVVTGGTIINQYLNQIEILWDVAGQGSITLTEENSSLCDATTFLNVTILPKPQPVIAGTQIVCTSAITQYSLAPLASGSSYSWHVTGGVIINTTNNTADILWQTVGAGVVSATEVNVNGCDSTVIFNVDVYQKPAPEIMGPDIVCRYEQSTYSTAYNASNHYTWNVTGGTITSQDSNSISIQWNGTGPGQITVTESNQSICDSTVSYNVMIRMQPTPAITGVGTICSNSASMYAVTGLHPNETINWSVAGGTILGPADADTISVMWVTPGSGNVTVLVLNLNGCDSTVSVPMNILDGPAPELSGPTQSCEQTTTTYSVNKVGDHRYYWQVTGGNIVSTTVDNEIEVYWSLPGNGLITLREVSPQGCDSTVYLNVRIDPKPLAAGNGPAAVCQNETSIFIAQPASGITYSWTANAATINGSNTQSSLYCAWQDTGNYMITLLETTQYGCTAQAQIPVRVHPKPTVAISGNSTGCYNTTSTYTVNIQSGILYQYSVTGGIIMSQNNGTLQIVWLGIGTHTLSVNATNTATGCDTVMRKAIVVDSLQRPVVAANGLIGCPPLNVSFLNNSNNSSYNYFWNFDDGVTATIPNPQHTFTTTGTFNIKVIATNNTGCADSANAIVRVHPQPTSDYRFLSGTEQVYAELEHMELDNLSSGAVGYYWDFGNGDVSHKFEPRYTYNSPGIYDISLAVVNSFGCTDIISKRIEVIVPEQIFVPNAFTPNGDAKNDFFTVKYNNIVSANIKIFNRWGEKIYESDDLYFRWDGDYKDRIVENEVYVYSIDAVGYYGTRIQKTGKITVLH